MRPQQAAAIVITTGAPRGNALPAVSDDQQIHNPLNPFHDGATAASAAAGSTAAAAQQQQQHHEADDVPFGGSYPPLPTSTNQSAMAPSAEAAGLIIGATAPLRDEEESLRTPPLLPLLPPTAAGANKGASSSPFRLPPPAPALSTRGENLHHAVLGGGGSSTRGDNLLQNATTPPLPKTPPSPAGAAVLLPSGGHSAGGSGSALSRAGGSTTPRSDDGSEPAGTRTPRTSLTRREALHLVAMEPEAPPLAEAADAESPTTAGGGGLTRATRGQVLRPTTDANEREAGRREPSLH